MNLCHEPNRPFLKLLPLGTIMLAGMTPLPTEAAEAMAIMRRNKQIPHDEWPPEDIARHNECVDVCYAMLTKIAKDAP